MAYLFCLFSSFWSHGFNKFQAEIVSMIFMELNMNNTYIKAIMHEKYKLLFGKNTSQCPDLYLEIKLRWV